MEEQKKKYLLSRIKKEELIIEAQYRQFRHMYQGPNILQEKLEPYLTLIAHLIQLNNTFAVQLIEFLDPSQVKSVFERFNEVFNDLFGKYKKVRLDQRFVQQGKTNGQNRKLCQICHEDFDNRRLVSIREKIDQESQTRAVLIKNLIEETEKERVKPLFTEEQDRIFKAELDKILQQKEAFVAKKIKETTLFLEKVTNEMSKLMIDFRDQFADRHDEPMEEGVNWTKMMKHFVNKKLATSFQGKIPDWIKKMFEMFLDAQPVKPKVYYCNKNIQTQAFATTSEVKARSELDQIKRRLSQQNRECEVFKAQIQLYKQETKELKERIKHISQELTDRQRQNSKLAKEKEELLIREELNNKKRNQYKQQISQDSEGPSIGTVLKSKKTLLGSELGSHCRLATNTNISVDDKNRNSEESHSGRGRNNIRQNINILNKQKSHKNIEAQPQGRTNLVERSSIKAQTKKLKKIVYNRLNREEQLSKQQTHKKGSSDVRQSRNKMQQVWLKDKDLKNVKEQIKEVAQKLKEKQSYGQHVKKPIISRKNSVENIDSHREKKGKDKMVSIANNSQFTKIDEEAKNQAYESSQTSKKSINEKVQIGTQTPSFQLPPEKILGQKETVATSQYNSLHEAVTSSIQEENMNQYHKEHITSLHQELLGNQHQEHKNGNASFILASIDPQQLSQYTPDELCLLEKMIKTKGYQSPVISCFQSTPGSQQISEYDNIASRITKSLQKSEFMTGCVVPLQRRNKSLFALESLENKQNHNIRSFLPKIDTIKRDPQNHHSLMPKNRIIKNKKDTKDRTYKPHPKPSRILSGIGQHLFMLFLNDDLAERYEESFNQMSSRKQKLLPTPSQLDYLKQMFAMLQLIQKNKQTLYMQVCAFMRCPYSESQNHFLARDIVKDLNFETFVNYFLKIMFIHRCCPIKGEACFCEHIMQFDIKLTMISEGKQLREIKA